MTTAERELDLAWDCFLKEEPASDRFRAHVESFRKREWPNIKRQLASDFRTELPEGLEPHWVRPAWAALWQRQVTSYKGQEQDNGWQPVRVPVGNAQQLHHYLNKGLRLRPPFHVPQDEALFEAAASQEAVRTDEAKAESERPQYQCDAHNGTKFRSWKAYLRHCEYYGEAPTATPPPLIVERTGKYAYYCFVHNTGFKQKHLAIRHVQAMLRRPGAKGHPTVEEMDTARFKEMST